MNYPAELLEKAKKIKVLALDVDGVFTNGQIFYGPQGDALKAFHTLDGLGLKLVQKAGIEVVIITGRHSDMVSVRMQELGVKHVYQGVKDKLATLSAFLDSHQLSLEQVAYCGDDLPDTPILEVCGLPVTVPNAHFSVKEVACWQTEREGGMGAVRDICDLLFFAQKS